MKVGVVGGGGAMGGTIGAVLAETGHNVWLYDVDPRAVATIQSNGLTIENSAGVAGSIPIGATTRPEEIGICDLVLVFVKCYHTVVAMNSASPMVGPETLVLSLQNGWGNGPVIAGIVGEDKLVIGVTYHSATLIEPGRVLHAGIGPTYIGLLNGTQDERTRRLAAELQNASFPIEANGNVLDQIWRKLCLNVCTLPTTSSLGLFNCQLIEREGTLELMKALLAEAVTVASGLGASVDYDERWAAITGLLAKVGMSKSSMLQDVSAKRRTEIDVVNGAIVASGKTLGVATPFNQSMVWMVEAVQGGYL